MSSWFAWSHSFVPSMTPRSAPLLSEKSFVSSTSTVDVRSFQDPVVVSMRIVATLCA
jgi:hypothetical protein